ncbi:MAG: metalloregulator ArsR/SmtB family transcription factor [Bacteroidales bacterium]|nr:metalloregulator ArsR/SmtB family transcription factor [Bacteroidales bacterium]
MVQAKTDLFEDQLVETASFFKVLAHPARLKILQFLSESDTCITGDISEELPLGRTTVNQHLKELKEFELIQGHIEGSKTRYCLNPEKLKIMEQLATFFFQTLELKEYNCNKKEIVIL